VFSVRTEATPCGKTFYYNWQVITYNGFYDNNLEWVGLEKVQIVGSMTQGNSMGRHSLSPRFTSIMKIYAIR
jgi:dynein heavy chain 2